MTPFRTRSAFLFSFYSRNIDNGKEYSHFETEKRDVSFRREDYKRLNEIYERISLGYGDYELEHTGIYANFGYGHNSVKGYPLKKLTDYEIDSKLNGLVISSSYLEKGAFIETYTDTSKKVTYVAVASFMEANVYSFGSEMSVAGGHHFCSKDSSLDYIFKPFGLSGKETLNIDICHERCDEHDLGTLIADLVYKETSDVVTFSTRISTSVRMFIEECLALDLQPTLKNLIQQHIAGRFNLKKGEASSTNLDIGEVSYKLNAKDNETNNSVTPTLYYKAKTFDDFLKLMKDEPDLSAVVQVSDTRGDPNTDGSLAIYSVTPGGVYEMIICSFERFMSNRRY